MMRKATVITSYHGFLKAVTTNNSFITKIVNYIFINCEFLLSLLKHTVYLFMSKYELTENAGV